MMFIDLVRNRLFFGSLFFVIVNGLVSMPPLSKMAEHVPLAKKAMKFFDNSPDPFHVIQTASEMLNEAGFKELNDREAYSGKILPGGKYYFTKNRSTIVAFTVGRKYVPGNGFKILGGHTDSPNLKVKPRSKRSSSGCIQLGVETYGGGLWHTWFDRDLGISGRVFIRNKQDGSLQQRLVKIDRPILRVPNLCIHLQSADERMAFKVNKEDHLSPILALEAQRQLEQTTTTTNESSQQGSNNNKSNNNNNGWTEHQSSILLQVLATELGLDDIHDIVDFELNLFDVQRASLGGACSEFIHSARLDNLATVFLAVQALIEYSSLEENLAQDSDISMIACFDHEEVGSASATGAGSPIMGDAVKRISSALCGSNNINADLHQSCLAKSFVLSVDQAHAVHPNYASKHEKQHQPKMNQGFVIKRNSNQRYATNGVTGFIIRQVAQRAGILPPQEFVVRNDCPCGSTIGPIISQVTGIRAIDIGAPSLSMHSIRETMGVADLTHGLALFKAYFSTFRSIDDALQ